VTAARICAPLLATALLSGCTSDWQRGYDRWYRYKAETGPYGRWALCIEERAGVYLDPMGADGSLRDRDAAGNRPQLFTNVLSDCREHMSDRSWSELDESEMRQLIADAYQAFLGVGAEIQAQMDASITD
jgi:hypothetical protein